MKRRLPVGVIVLTFAFSSIAGAMQQPQTSPPPGAPTPQIPPRATPTRDGAQAKGTAILRGYVTAADTGAPIRRAMVRTVSSDSRATGIAQTDAQGRFEIRDLVAGRYSINVTKAGFVSMTYGARRPNQPGLVLTIADNQLVEKIAVALPRGGVVTGRILDDLGEPMAGVQVSALQLQYSPSGRRPVPMQTDTTDDQGTYRLYGLAPAQYQIVGRLRDPNILLPGATVSQTTIEGFAPTYYPGTANVAEAQYVSVKAGAETGGVIFSLIATRLARISGRVLSSAGEPLIGAMVNLSASNMSEMMMGGGSSFGQTRADGTFELTGVAPGSYQLMARPSPARAGDNPEFGVLSLTVGPADIDNLTISTARGAIARGVITTDEGTTLPLTPAQVSLGVTAAEPGRMTMGSAPPKINDDWTFELSNLFDRLLLRAGVSTLANSRDWRMKAVLWNGEDVTDRPFDFAPGQVLEGLEVVFTRKITEISGLVMDDTNQPVIDATVLLFPGNADQWRTSSRFVRTVRPDQQGRYEFRNMPPHDDYLAVAVREMESGRQWDPEFLDSLRDVATRLRLNEGETKVQNLKIQ